MKFCFVLFVVVDVLLFQTILSVRLFVFVHFVQSSSNWTKNSWKLKLITKLINCKIMQSERALHWPITCNVLARTFRVHKTRNVPLMVIWFIYSHTIESLACAQARSLSLPPSLPLDHTILCILEWSSVKIIALFCLVVHHVLFFRLN